MKKKPCIFSLLLITFILIYYWVELIAYMFIMVDSVKDFLNADQIKNTISIIASFLSVAMYIKLRFYDTRLFNRLQGIYGKQKFIDSLEIVLKMLDSFPPDVVIEKISLINDMEIEILNASKQLNNILNPKSESEVNLELSKKDLKILNEKIKILTDIIDKRLQIHYISEGSPFDVNIKRAKKQKEKIEQYLEKQSEKGKKKILDAIDQKRQGKN